MVKTPPCSKYEPPENIMYTKNDKQFCRKITKIKKKINKKTKKNKQNIPNNYNVLIEENNKNINGENIKMIDFSWKKSVFIDIWICNINNITEESSEYYYSDLSSDSQENISSSSKKKSKSSSKNKVIYISDYWKNKKSKKGDGIKLLKYALKYLSKYNISEVYVAVVPKFQYYSTKKLKKEDSYQQLKEYYKKIGFKDYRGEVMHSNIFNIIKS